MYFLNNFLLIFVQEWLVCLKIGTDNFQTNTIKVYWQHEFFWLSWPSLLVNLYRAGEMQVFAGWPTLEC